MRQLALFFFMSFSFLVTPIWPVHVSLALPWFSPVGGASTFKKADGDSGRLLRWIPAFADLPDSVGAYSSNAWIESEDSATLRALGMLRQRSRMGTPSGIDIRLVGTAAAIRQGQSQMAWEILIEIGPQAKSLRGDRTRLLRALFLFTVGQTDSALGYLRRLQSLDNSVGECARRTLSGFYLVANQKMESDAMIRLGNALAENRNKPYWIGQRAIWARLHGGGGDLIAFLDAIHLDGLSRELRVEYGGLLVDAGFPERAIPVLSSALKEGLENGVRAGSAYGWYRLAQARFLMGYHFFALDDLSQAYGGMSTDARYYSLYAKILSSCCMVEEDERTMRARKNAIEQLEKGLAYNLHDREMVLLLARLYGLDGRVEAVANLRRDLGFHFDAIGSKPALKLGRGEFGHSSDPILKYTWSFAAAIAYPFVRDQDPFDCTALLTFLMRKRI